MLLSYMPLGAPVDMAYEMRFSMDDSKDEAFKVARNFRKFGAWPSTSETGMIAFSSSYGSDRYRFAEVDLWTMVVFCFCCCA